MDYKWLFDGVGGAAALGLIGAGLRFFLKNRSSNGNKAALNTGSKTTASIRGSIYDSTVAFGGNIDQSKTEIHHHHSPGAARVNKVILGVLVVCAVGGFAYGPLEEKYQDYFGPIPYNQGYLEAWGTFSNFTVWGDGNQLKPSGDEPDAYITVNGALLARYGFRRKLIGVCFHVWNSQDYRDVEFISESAAYDIDPTSIPISIKLHRGFLIEEVLPPLPTTVSYVLLAVPSKVGPKDFKTIREAEKLGAEVIAKASAADPRRGTVQIK
jgi:hypothetical protein